MPKIIVGNRTYGKSKAAAKLKAKNEPLADITLPAFLVPRSGDMSLGASHSPVQSHNSFGADPGQAFLMDALAAALGKSGGVAAKAALADPEVKAAVEGLTEQCKTQAQAGATLFFKENWPWFALGGVALIGGNVITNLLMIGAFFSGRS